MKNYENLGHFLQEARINSNFTQKELSDLLGFGVQFVSNWERGLCAPPERSFQNLIKILRIDSDKLVKVMHQRC